MAITSFITKILFYYLVQRFGIWCYLVESIWIRWFSHNNLCSLSDTCWPVCTGGQLFVYTLRKPHACFLLRIWSHFRTVNNLQNGNCFANVHCTLAEQHCTLHIVQPHGTCGIKILYGKGLSLSLQKTLLWYVNIQSIHSSLFTIKSIKFYITKRKCFAPAI